MNLGGYEAFEDPYAYKGSTVLRNRLQTRDWQKLQSFELEMTALRLEEPLPSGRFSMAHYCAIHRHIFRDVYSWAGRFRTVRTGKGGNWFCFPEYIPHEMSRIFGALRDDQLLAGRTFNHFIEGAALFLADLNAVHPFREGNGRAQLSFLHLLAIKAGHPLNLRRIRADEFLEAMIVSFAGDTALLQAEIARLRVT